MHISILGNLTLDDVKCCNINVRYYFNINLVLVITICGNKHTILCSLTHFKKQNIKNRILLHIVFGMFYQAYKFR